MDSKDEWERPISRREFYQFHLEREATIAAMAAFISVVLGLSFAGSAASTLLSGSGELVGQDIGVACLGVIGAVVFSRRFAAVRRQQKKIDEA